MILTQNNDIETTEMDQGVDFSIDQESLGLLFKGFSDSLYSNKIGSIVREIASNCFDAHQALGTNKEIEITLKRPDSFTNEQGSISFRDFGIGLSPEAIKNIYSRYFASTKRSTNDQIGGFGIGAKSPLAYTDIFDVYTIIDDIEYHYMIHRGEKVPRIELVNKQESTKERGTEIVIPVKSDEDADKFETEIKSQLRYFDGIKYFGIDIPNDYQIIKGNTFIYNSLDEAKNNVISLCIGKVRYPLNVELVFPREHASNLKSDIALYFNVGELSVTMNRESIEYTDTAIELIQDRFKKAEEEFMEIRESIAKKAEIEDLLEAIEFSTSREMIFPGGFKAYTPFVWKKFRSQNLNNWAYAPLKDCKIYKPLESYFEFALKFSHRYISRGQGKVHKQPKKTSRFKTVYQLLKEQIEGVPTRELWRNKGTITSKKMDYLKSLCTREEFAVCTLNEHIGVMDLEYSETIPYPYQEGFNKKLLKNDEQVKEDARKELKLILNHYMRYFMKHSKSVNKTEIDPAWEKAYKEARRSGNYDKTLITLRDYHKGYRMTKMKAGDFYKNFACKDQVVIYGYQGEESELQTANYYAQLALENNYRVVKIARDNAKYLKAYYSKAYHVDEFQEVDFIKKRIEIKKALINFRGKVSILPDDVISKLSFFLRTTKRLQRGLDNLNYLDNYRYFSGLKRINEFTIRQIPENEDLHTFEIIDNVNNINLGKLLEAVKRFLDDNPLFIDLVWELEPDQAPGSDKMKFFQSAIKNHFNIFKL